MLKKSILLVTLPFMMFACRTPQEAGVTPAPQQQNTQTMINSDLEKLSYGLGLNIASNLQNEGIDSLNVDLVAKAINDVFQGNEKQMSLEEANAAIQAYFQKAQAAKFGKNMEEGKKFLEENKKRPEVVELPSGLQYQVMREGTGARPSATDQVTVHYHGTLIDGTIFDSSVQRGEPATFPVNGVIRGWVEALQLMQEGAKWRLFIPSDLAYGERGAGGAIGPHATLIFEVELLKIVKQ